MWTAVALAFLGPFFVLWQIVTIPLHLIRTGRPIAAPERNTYDR